MIRTSMCLSLKDDGRAKYRRRKTISHRVRALRELINKLDIFELYGIVHKYII